MTDRLEQRLAANLEMVMGEIMAPRTSRSERALQRIGVPERSARLMAATPAWRWSWFAAIAAVLVFAAGAAGEWQGNDQLAILLAIAPLVPVVAVALSYSPGVDQSREVLLVAPLSGLRLLLLRTTAVLALAIAVSLIAALAAPTGGWLRLAWLLPSLATTSMTLLLGSRWGLGRSAAGVSVGWLAIVAVAGQSASDAVAAFNWAGQLAAAIVAAAATVLLVGARHRWEHSR
jgi:hypothetical protein